VADVVALRGTTDGTTVRARTDGPAVRGRTDGPAVRVHTDGPAGRLAEMASIIRGAGLDGLVRPASQPVDVPSVTNEILPVVAALRPLLPWGGLRRGSTIAVPDAAAPPGSGQFRAAGVRGDAPSAGRDVPPDGAASGRAHSGPVAREDGAGPPRGRAHLSVVPPAVAPVAAAVPALVGQLARGAGGAPVPVGATSALLALLSAASAGGSWCAVVGLPAFGARAAGEFGICLERLVLVPHPGADWPMVVAALLDGFDLVVVGAPGVVAAAVANRLSARARQRGSVLVATGAWAGAELTLTPVDNVWHGLGQGRGRLVGRELTLAVHGRGAAARPRYAQLTLPAAADPAAGEPATGTEPAALTAVGA
jgi:hypothetical protein